MFGRWFSRKEKREVGRPAPRPPLGFRIREPEARSSKARAGRPPLDADRDFVYHER